MGRVSGKGPGGGTAAPQLKAVADAEEWGGKVFAAGGGRESQTLADASLSNKSRSLV